METTAMKLSAITTIISLCLLASTGCSSEEVSRGRVLPGNNGTVMFDGGDTGKQCAALNRTQACACNALSGRQTCTAQRMWSACECLDPMSGAAGTGGGGGTGSATSANDPPANKLAASFEWLRTDPTTSAPICLPGHYEGTFDGGYNSPAAWNAPVPVAAADASGMPGLRFDLGSGGNGEFLTITGGMMDGVADVVFPFRAQITEGQLDCSTGLFRAKITMGSYDVFFLAFTGYFEGDMVARFDPASRSFVDGVWAVMEGGKTPPPIEAGMEPPLIPIGESGGAGTWTTTWVR
jgi:hypothetical protein